MDDQGRIVACEGNQCLKLRQKFLVDIGASTPLFPRSFSVVLLGGRQ